MNTVNPKTTRLMLIASIVLFALASALLAINVAKVFSAPLASAVNVPTTVGFEGYLVDGSGNPMTGTVSLKFTIYDASTGGTLKWSETQNPVQVTNGLYAVELGIAPPFTDTTTIFSGGRWLGITVNGGSELSPRTKISAVPFAINAKNAHLVDDLPVAASGANAHLLQTDASGNATLSGGLTASAASISDGLNVGGATGATAGDVRMSGSIDLSTPLGARVYHTATQSISNSTNTMVAFNAERWDTDVIHDTATNNSRLTCKTAGKYLIMVSYAWASNATGNRFSSFMLNGATSISAVQSVVPLGGAETRINFSTVYDLAVNDYVEVLVFQTSGAALNIVTGANYSPEFMMVRLP